MRRSEFYFNAIYASHPIMKYATNKNSVYHIDDNLSIDSKDLNDSGQSNK